MCCATLAAMPGRIPDTIRGRFRPGCGTRNIQHTVRRQIRQMVRTRIKCPALNTALAAGSFSHPYSRPRGLRSIPSGVLTASSCARMRKPSFLISCIQPGPAGGCTAGRYRQSSIPLTGRRCFRINAIVLRIARTAELFTLGEPQLAHPARLLRIRCNVRRCMLRRRAVSDTLRPLAS